MKARKILVSLAALALVAAISIGGTLAYLTSKTDTVTNTFSVGKVEITLDEAKVDLYGNADAAATRVNANSYRLIPGHEYTKDPTIHFQPNSEASWLFVKVEDEIKDIEADTKIEAQILAKGWTKLDNVAGDVYWKKVPANMTAAAVDYPVFDSFTLTDDANVSNYNEKTIKVTAYAVQADGIDQVATAWDAANK